MPIRGENGSAKYLTTAQVRARYGDRSHMWLVRKVKFDPHFPKPHKFGGRLNLYDLSELEAYERSFVAGEAA